MSRKPRALVPAPNAVLGAPRQDALEMKNQNGGERLQEKRQNESAPGKTFSKKVRG